MPDITLKALTWHRAGRDIIAGVDHRISGTGPTVIVGPNGAGKSVLLRLMHGLLMPDAGAVEVDGSPLNRAARLAQAMVFQKPVLLRRTAEANVAYALRCAGLDAAEAEQWLVRAGLADKARQPARSMSGGEAQRLAVIRALATKPRTLFLDEPTSALDPAATAAVEALIGEAVSDGVQIVMVSHDLGQVRRIAKEIIMMHQGAIVESGPAAAMLQKAKVAQTRAFLNGELVL